MEIKKVNGGILLNRGNESFLIGRTEHWELCEFLNLERAKSDIEFYLEGFCLDDDMNFCGIKAEEILESENLLYAIAEEYLNISVYNDTSDLVCRAINSVFGAT